MLGRENYMKKEKTAMKKGKKFMRKENDSLKQGKTNGVLFHAKSPLLPKPKRKGKVGVKNGCRPHPSRHLPPGSFYFKRKNGRRGKNPLPPSGKQR